MKNSRRIRITHRPSGEVIAEGPLGWGIMRFEGNYYIGRQYLQTKGFKVNYIPGLCIYKFLYVWLDFSWTDGKSRSLGWLYWLPNPLLPFIWYRVAVPDDHPDLEFTIQETASA
jgi:uncharacterized protein (DUF427 family)